MFVLEDWFKINFDTILFLKMHEMKLLTFTFHGYCHVNINPYFSEIKKQLWK